jgi:hypothetical protein
VTEDWPKKWLEPNDGTRHLQDLDTGVAHSARVYDYWLGGKDNFAADRAAAKAAMEANPYIVNGAIAGRAFLGRAVRYLTGTAGVRQILDIGSGLPTANNTHEVAQAQAPDAKVVYVDNDPLVLVHAKALLNSTPQGATAYLDADLHEPESILEQAAATLDFDQPVAVMLLSMLHLLPDDEHPYDLVARLMRDLVPGSHLVITHPASDIRAAAAAESLRRLNNASGNHAVFRDHAAVSRFFAGLELLEPGVVTPPRWRPAPGDNPDTEVPLWSGAARKA